MKTRNQLSSSLEWLEFICVFTFPMKHNATIKYAKDICSLSA